MVVATRATAPLATVIPVEFGTAGRLSQLLVGSSLPPAVAGIAQWTHSDVKSAVHWLVTKEFGVTTFNDDDDFVRDLGTG